MFDEYDLEMVKNNGVRMNKHNSQDDKKNLLTLSKNLSVLVISCKNSSKSISPFPGKIQKKR